MYSFITLCCLFGAVIPPAVLNIIAYPISRRWSCAISQYIVKVLAPRVFAILNCYRHFSFFGYSDSKKMLPEQFMIISNHQSLFDIPAFMNFFREKELRFVAKDNLSRHIPLVSEMLRAHRHCMIPRKGSPMVAMKIMESFGKQVLENNQIPVLFPEGTRSRDGNVGKFYSAGFRKLNEAAGLPVVACAVDGGSKIRDKKEKQHKQEFLKNEMIKRKLDEEEQKFKEKQDLLATERAKKYYFNSQDLVKSFRSKMLFCDILQERKVQINQNQKIKERWNEYEKYWNEVEKEKMEEYDKEELRKIEIEKEKREKQMNFISQQFQESKIRRIHEMQERYVEGQLNKINALNELKEEQAKKEKEKQNRILLNEKFKLANIELEKLKEEQKKKEEEENKIIEKHAKHKEELENLRKQKEKEKFEERQKQRQKLIDAQAENLRKIKEETERKVNQDVKQKEIQDQKNEQMKKEKYEKMLKEIEEDRRLYLQRLKETKEKIKKEEQFQVEQWRKEIKDNFEKERNEYLLKRQKMKELHQYRTNQAKEKKQKAMEEYLNLQEENLKNKYLLNKENDEFIKFAEEQIKLYKSQGKDILPLLLELKIYKKNGLLN